MFTVQNGHDEGSNAVYNWLTGMKYRLALSALHLLWTQHSPPHQYCGAWRAPSSPNCVSPQLLLVHYAPPTFSFPPLQAMQRQGSSLCWKKARVWCGWCPSLADQGIHTKLLLTPVILSCGQTQPLLQVCFVTTQSLLLNVRVCFFLSVCISLLEERHHSISAVLYNSNLFS